MPCNCDSPAAYSMLWKVKSCLAAAAVDKAPGSRRGRCAAVGWVRGTWGTQIHTRCLPISCWQGSKESKACSAQGTGERLFTRVYRSSCEGKARVYSSVKHTWRPSDPKATVLPAKGKEGGESALTWVFYMHLTKEDIIKQSYGYFAGYKSPLF